MEFSLTNPRNGKILQFNTFSELMDYIKKTGEIDGWILRIHHM